MFVIPQSPNPATRQDRLYRLICDSATTERVAAPKNLRYDGKRRCAQERYALYETSSFAHRS